MYAFEVERSSPERRFSNQGISGCNKPFYLLLLSLIVIFSGGVIFLLHFLLEYQRLSHGITMLNLHNAEALSNMSCEEQYCESEHCVTTASRMMSLVNLNADPCEDFYEYACGGYEQFKSIPYTFSSYNPAKESRYEILVNIRKLMESSSTKRTSQTFQKMKMFYQSCMNQEERNRLARNDVEDFFVEHELSMENAEHNSEQIPSWMQLVSRLEEYKIHTVFTTSFKDSETSPIERIEVDCLAPLLPIEVYIDSVHAHKLGVYEDLILKTLKLLSLGDILRKEMASQILQIETDIALSFQKYKPNDSSTIAEEHKIQIREILRPLIGDAVQEVEIVSTCKYHLDSLITILNKSPRRMANTYVNWRMMLQLLPFLGSEFRDLHVHYVAEYFGLNYAYLTRWRECADAVREDFGLPAVQFLMEEGYIERGIIQSVNRTFLELKRSFARTLRFFGSKDDRMNKIFFNKLSAIRLNTGYQNVINDDKLDEVYNALEIGDNYFKNVLHLKKFKARYFLMRLWYGNGDSQRSEISLSRNPLGGEASYDYISNTVNIDLGILLPPVFIAAKNYPNYLKYGPSSIIAREVSRAFDATGIFYDADGNKLEKEFWPQILLRKYESFASCLRNQLLFLNDAITEVNETKVLNQAIADLGSLDISYKALSSHLFYSRDGRLLPGVSWTKRQSFFILASQMVCELRRRYSNLNSNIFSLKYRINTVVSNIKGFATAFQCSSTSVLNPATKCNFLQ